MYPIAMLIYALLLQSGNSSETSLSIQYKLQFCQVFCTLIFSDFSKTITPVKLFLSCI